MSTNVDKYEEIACFDASECEYKRCPLYNFETHKCKIESLRAPRVPVGDQPQRIEETTTDFTVGKYVDVQGKVLSTPEYKTGTRQDGTEWKMAKFDFEIEAEIMSIALWDDFAIDGLKFTVDDKLFLKGMKVNKPYEGRTQLGSAKYTEVTKLN